MARKVFTTESLSALIDEIKAYVTGLVSKKAETDHEHEIANITGLEETLDMKADAGSVAYIDENDNETVIISDDINKIADLIGGDA